MLQFDPSTGLVADEVETVRQRVRDEWISAFTSTDAPALNTDPSTPQGQLIDSQTAAIVQKDSEILYLSSQFNPLTAEGIYQDALAQIYFITRQPAIASTALCTCTGRQGTTIRQGSIIESVTDRTQWRCLQDGTIPQEGTIDLRFECTQTGPIAAAAQTLSHIVTVTAGWDTVTNSEPAVAGRDEENQGAFEARRYQSVALNSRSAVASVYGRVGQVEGVLSLYVTDNRKDIAVEIDGVTLKPHSIFVSVTGGEDYDIAKAIYDSCSAGCDFNGNTTVTVVDDVTAAENEVTFDRPENIQVGVQVTLQESPDLPSNAAALVRDAVFANFYGTSGEIQGGQPLLRVSQGDDVFSSRFYPSIVNAGINYILGVELAILPAEGEPGWAQVIHVPINQNPVLAKENITVTINPDPIKEGTINGV